MAALAFFVPNASPSTLRACRRSEMPSSVGLKFLKALTWRDIKYRGVGCRMSFDDPGRRSARKYLLKKKVSASFPQKLKKNRNLLPIPSLVSFEEPENSMVSVSPAIVLGRFTKSFPSSCSLTKLLNAVSLGGVRDGKLADPSTIRKENELWGKSGHTHQALAQPE